MTQEGLCHHTVPRGTLTYMLHTIYTLALRTNVLARISLQSRCIGRIHAYAWCNVSLQLGGSFSIASCSMASKRHLSHSLTSLHRQAFHKAIRALNLHHILSPVKEKAETYLQTSCLAQTSLYLFATVEYHRDNPLTLNHLAGIDCTYAYSNGPLAR